MNAHIIVGGGLAGLTLGVRLARGGYPVRVFEKRPYAGGRVYSFSDSATGDTVDNGQHIFMACCEQLRQLYKDVGAPLDDYLKDQLSVRLRTRSGTDYHLRETRSMPVPFNFIPILWQASFLTWGERLSIASCFRTIRGLTWSEIEQLDHMTLETWLLDHQQTKDVIEQFWNLFIISTLNGPAEEVSARSGLFVFKRGLLQEAGGGAIGVVPGGQSPYYVKPLIEEIEEHGGTVSFRSPVDQLWFQDGRCSGVKVENENVGGKTVTLAVPAPRAAKFLRNTPGAGETLDGVRDMDTAPIVSINMWLQEVLIDSSFQALLGSPIHWIFNRNRIENRDRHVPQHVVLVKSFAGDWLQKDLDRIRQIAVEELLDYFPDFRAGDIQNTRIVKEPDATFFPGPETESLRPEQDTTIPGLYVAGAWTDTKWPSTMESAVRSGERVAEYIQSL